jgi:hypothetical protein
MVDLRVISISFLSQAFRISEMLEHYTLENFILCDFLQMQVRTYFHWTLLAGDDI